MAARRKHQRLGPFRISSEFQDGSSPLWFRNFDAAVTDAPHWSNLGSLVAVGSLKHFSIWNLKVDFKQEHLPQVSGYRNLSSLPSAGMEV